MAAIAGTYKYESQENFEAALEAMGKCTFLFETLPKSETN